MPDPAERERLRVVCAVRAAVERLTLLLDGPPAGPVRVVTADGVVRITVEVSADTPPQPWHSADFREVRWPGLGDFAPTPKQALVVARLWRAREEGEGPVGQRELLQAADSDCDRLVDLFKGSPSWGRLVVPLKDGTYRLPEQ